MQPERQRERVVVDAHVLLFAARGGSVCEGLHSIGGAAAKIGDDFALGGIVDDKPAPALAIAARGRLLGGAHAVNDDVAASAG